MVCMGFEPGAAKLVGVDESTELWRRPNWAICDVKKKFSDYRPSSVWRSTRLRRQSASISCRRSFRIFCKCFDNLTTKVSGSSRAWTTSAWRRPRTLRGSILPTSRSSSTNRTRDCDANFDDNRDASLSEPSMCGTVISNASCLYGPKISGSGANEWAFTPYERLNVKIIIRQLLF